MSTVNLGKMLIEYKRRKYCHSIKNLYKKYCTENIIDKHYCEYLEKKIFNCSKIEFKS